MTNVLTGVIAAFALGILIGWIARGWLTAWLSDAQSELHQADALSDANWRTGTVYCPRCGRLDGSHTTDCERARLDQIVPPLRGKRFDARSRGYAGADGQDLPQSDGRAARGANSGTKDRR